MKHSKIKLMINLCYKQTQVSPAYELKSVNSPSSELPRLGKIHVGEPQERSIRDMS